MVKVENGKEKKKGGRKKQAVIEIEKGLTKLLVKMPFNKSSSSISDDQENGNKKREADASVEEPPKKKAKKKTGSTDSAESAPSGPETRRRRNRKKTEEKVTKGYQMPTSQSPEDIMGKWFEDSDNRKWTAFVNELNSTQASTLQKLLASKTNTALPKDFPKAALPKDVPKAAPPKDVPKAAPSKNVPKAALPKDIPKAALPKDTPPKGTPKEEVAVAPHMSPDNLSVDICDQEHCRKGARYKAAMKLKRKLFDNETNSSTVTDSGNKAEKLPTPIKLSTVTDGGNNEEKIPTPIKLSTITDGGNKEEKLPTFIKASTITDVGNNENTLLTPVKTGNNQSTHHDKRKKGEDTVSLDLGAIDWSSVSTESAGQYTVMFGG